MTKPQTFVKVWMECASVTDVAKRLSITTQSASARATNLRARGVKLPRKKPTAHPVSVDELNKIVASYTPQTAKPKTTFSSLRVK